MRDQPSGGHIFNMDGAGADGGATPRFAAYGASKRGLAQLGKSLQVCLLATAVCMLCHQSFKADRQLSQPPLSMTDTDHVILPCITFSSTEITKYLHSMCRACALSNLATNAYTTTHMVCQPDMAGGRLRCTEACRDQCPVCTHAFQTCLNSP